MPDYGFHDYTETEVVALTEYLKNCASKERVAHYDDAYDVVRQPGT
jgi:hypothetical protein